MSLKFKNTEAFLINYVRRMIQLTKQEIDKPRSRVYKNKKTGTRLIKSPLNASGSLKNSLRLDKKFKNIVSEKGFKATQSYRILGNSYGEILDEGAIGSKVKATISGLENWIQNKPVKLTGIKNKTKVATLIKEKIDRDGIKGIGFLQELVNQQFNNVLGIESELVKDIDLNLEDILITLGWDKKGQNTYTRNTK